MSKSNAFIYSSPQMSLCEDFMDRAIATWCQIKISESVGINISEESITDYRLIELQVKHPNEIKTKKYSKRREAKIGADWEWWLGSGSFWFGLRVQAKKVFTGTMIYQNLDEMNKYGRQVDLLINGASKNNPPCMPIYVLYNYWDINQFDPPWLCGTYSKSIEMFGCSVSHALFVKTILDQGSNDLRDIAEGMYPWSCLVCCQGFSKEKGKLPFRAFDFLSGAYKKYTEKTDLGPHEKERFVVREAPSYVYRILEGVELSEADWSDIKVDRVTVIYEK